MKPSVSTGEWGSQGRIGGLCSKVEFGFWEEEKEPKASFGLFLTQAGAKIEVDARVVGSERRRIAGYGTVATAGMRLEPDFGMGCGREQGSPMLAPAMRYLTLRSLGAPAVLLSLAMQGVFRGFKDTRTPLYATMAGDLTNIILDPILIFVFHMGVSGAAIAHVISQYFITLILLCRLINKVDIVPHSIKSFKFARFLRCGFLLLARVIAVTFCVTMAASLAAHHGPTPMAAFQICLQVWLSTSLLADGLAVAGQAILASAFAKGDLQKVAAATSRVLQLSIVLGLALSALLGFGLRFGSGIFTKDINVIKQVHKAIPFVAGTQTINSLAFVFDGVNFGASDYTFSAYSMVAVAAVSIPSLIFLSNSHGFVGIWIALTIYMSLRTFASVWRMGSATGPWTLIRK